MRRAIRRPSRFFAPTLALFGALGASAGCGTLLAIQPDDGGTDDASAEASSDVPAMRDGPASVVDGAPDAPMPVPCTPKNSGADVLLCVPRFGTDGGDGAAPFLSGPYAFDKGNASSESRPELPNTQRATVYVSWDADYLYFFGSMKDPASVTDVGSPFIELMACAGDPDSSYDEAQCVDFWVDYANNLRAPARFNTTGAGITHSASGNNPTDFNVFAKVPAGRFGALFAGKRMSFNVNAVSYETPDGTAPLPPSMQTSMSAFLIGGRTCNHDGGTGDWACGAGDQSYEPVTWARLVLY